MTREERLRRIADLKKTISKCGQLKARPGFWINPWAIVSYIATMFNVTCELRRLEGPRVEQ